MSYGAERSECDRQFRGLGPSQKAIDQLNDAVEQPAHFRFIVNLKTAKALGLEMPATLLGMADDVID
jgi:putative ABC transport system substrate-binding protein